MDSTKSPRPRGRAAVLSSLNVAIEVLNLAKEVSSATPAKAVFGSVSALLVMIKDTMANQQDCVELGMTCANVCQALGRGLNGRQLDELSQSVVDAILQLNVIVADIRRKMIKQGKQNAASRFFHSKSDKDRIAGWKQDLQMILQVFDTELQMNNHVILLDIHRNTAGGQKDSGSQHQPAASAPVGELAPPPPRACFGRDELIEKIISLAENLTPVALVGAGGIGKTSIALTVLHHGRIKERFGDNRRFIRCDQFAASRANLLNRLSKALGTGVENPEDLVPLRPFLSSKELFLVFDNAESILDPHGPNGREIFEVMEELSRFNNICLCITSRLTTIPPDCKRFNVPPLSVDAARSTFCQICDKDDRPDLINAILEQLDFHPLSITLLATVAHQNDWDNDLLAREWKQKQTGMLQTGHNKSLAAAIELSLASPMFKGLGPNARELLGIVTFFPQGVDGKNFNWLFPTIPDASTIFFKFCNLSLTHRSNGFFTMLAPLRDHLRPEDPASHPLLCATRDCYFARMSIEFDESKPVFGESRWIVSEDVNVEHLLDFFTSVDPNSADVWNACRNFMEHLYWHKKRLVVLGPKVEGLPDDHPAKSRCLFTLSRLFESVGSDVERERLLVNCLKLRREGGNEDLVAWTLMELSDANRMLHRFKEGIEHAKEALEFYRQLGDTIGQANCLGRLARVLYDDDQTDAAEGAASHALNLLPEKGQEILVCQSHRFLGDIYRSKGKKEKAIHHLEAALRIASLFNWHNQLFWIHHSLAELFCNEAEFNKANAHVDQAKSHTVDHSQYMGRAIELQAEILYQQLQLGEAKSKALLAMETYIKLGSSQDVEDCRNLLYRIEQAVKIPSTSKALDSDAHDI